MSSLEDAIAYDKPVYDTTFADFAPWILPGVKSALSSYSGAKAIAAGLSSDAVADLAAARTATALKPVSRVPKTWRSLETPEILAERAVQTSMDRFKAIYDFFRLGAEELHAWPLLIKYKWLETAVNQGSISPTDAIVKLLKLKEGAGF